MLVDTHHRLVLLPGIENHFTKLQITQKQDVTRNSKIEPITANVGCNNCAAETVNISNHTDGDSFKPKF